MEKARYEFSTIEFNSIDKIYVSNQVKLKQVSLSTNCLFIYSKKVQLTVQIFNIIEILLPTFGIFMNLFSQIAEIHQCLKTVLKC